MMAPLQKIKPVRQASATKVAEAYDCVKDYKSGGLSYEEYIDCLKRFKDEDDDYGGGGGGGYYRPYPQRYPVTRVHMTEKEMSENRDLVSKTLVALATDPTPNKKETQFLYSILRTGYLSDKQRSWRDSIVQKLMPIIRQIPQDLVKSLTWSQNYYPDFIGRSDDPQHVEFADKFWSDNKTDGRLIRIGPARRTPLVHTPPAQTDPPASQGSDQNAKLKILDAVLARRPDGFIQSIRDQVARGRSLSEAQLRAVRAVLYRNNMRPEADSFRMASHHAAWGVDTHLRDFIDYMENNAIGFSTGLLGWWLPAHNMAVRLTKTNKVIVLKYHMIPDETSPKQAYSPGVGQSGPMLTVAPMWRRHPKYTGLYAPTEVLAKKLVGLMSREPTIPNTVKAEMQWVNDMFDVIIPASIVTQLSMKAVKNAISRWYVPGIKFQDISL